MVTIDSKNKVFNYFVGDKSQNWKKVVTGDINKGINITGAIRDMVFGDKHGKEMNHELVEIEVDPIYHDAKDFVNINLMNQNFPIPCTYNCRKCDYMNQDPKKSM